MTKKQRNSLIIGGVLFVLILFFGITYNGLVQKEENVEKAWAQVETVYQRRADLVPNLVNTVKGVADYEKETLEAVMNARAQATATTIDPQNLTKENFDAFNQAQSNLSGSINRLLAVVERYPELKATQNFSELQQQLESTENRISVERQRYNETVNTYNGNRKKFPTNVVAGIFGFSEKPYYQADAGAEKAPEVSF
ncbi:LemA family protein [Bacteroidales bacterium OttesenSCG-928-B11]|nr:LemA family protein [Bacteroidales bacterium OttesenSCG-928-C03]MDL2312149.1 LemA family protein [Bacteroidales bacterium OttesenSCG-928-B11]